MRNLKFSNKTVFRVLDRRKLKNHVDESNQPDAFYEGWRDRGIPRYIIVRGDNEVLDELNYEGDKNLEGSVDMYRIYDTYDVHENYDVSTNCYWVEERLEYLLEKEIIREEGYYSQLNKMENIAEGNASEFNLKNYDELETVEESLQK